MEKIVTPAQTARTFEVLTCKRHAFEQQMKRLERKAIKLGVEPPSYTMAAPVFVQRTGTDGDKYMVEVCFTTVTAQIVKLPGWTFLATLEHLEGGETLLRSMVAEPLPVEYRTAGPKCDHCKLARKRNDTFLVRSDAGQVVQIGRSCIADFLGHTNPEHLAMLAEYVAALTGSDEDGWGEGAGGPAIADILQFVSVATSLARLEGFKSKKMVEDGKASLTTARTVMEVLFPQGDFWKKESPKVLAAVTDADREKAQASIDWITGLEGEVNDFLHNVRAVVRTGAVKDRTAGYAAALTVAYAKEMDQLKAKGERPVSTHQGTVGERTVFTLTIGKIIPIEGQYGISYLHLMTDAAGNDFKWFGSGKLWLDMGLEVPGKDADEGDTVTIKATVKGHEVYKDRAQTQLTRCAVHVEKPKKIKAKKVPVVTP